MSRSFSTTITATPILTTDHPIAQCVDFFAPRSPDFFVSRGTRPMRLNGPSIGEWKRPG